MSREVIGDAPNVAEQRADPVPVPPPAPATGTAPAGVALEVRFEPPELRAIPRRAVVAAALVLTLAAGTIGFVRGGPPATKGTGVTAAVVGAVRVAGGSRETPGPSRAMVTVGLVNPGPEAVRIDGYVAGSELTSGGYQVPRATVPAHGRGELTVDVALRCDQPQDLGMPPLRLRTRDHGGRAVEPVGAADALTELCAAAAPVMQVLRAFRLGGGAARLVVEIGTLDRRPTKIDAVYAGSVPLDVGPLPARVGGAYPLMITPPPTCPAAWQQDGMPTGVTIEVDGGRGPATVDVHVGVAMARWALETSCSVSV